MTTSILARFHRAHLEAQNTALIAAAIGEPQTAENANAERENPTMGNEAHARGVPIMARGIGGAINGTRPGDDVDFDGTTDSLTDRRNLACIPLREVSPKPVQEAGFVVFKPCR